MRIKIISNQTVHTLKRRAEDIPVLKVICVLSVLFAGVATYIFYSLGTIVSYGDAESHLNIAKRVVDSLTPGFAQLGGIWLPLPHILMIPFVFFDPLWRTGLAGSIVSGLAYSISCVFLYLLTYKITENKLASFVAFLVFALNLNILYLQSTPMTELTLILFFVLSVYFFVKYVRQENTHTSLIFASFFAFCASLSRYDGWFLVVFEAFCIVLFYLQKHTVMFDKKISNFFHTSLDKKLWDRFQGEFILFSTLAAFGILLWFLWDFIILGDPLYFTNSIFSAKNQQENWLSKGELPGYHNIFLSFLYYFITSMSDSGVVVFIIALFGFFYYIFNKDEKNKLILITLLNFPFVFYVVTLFMGQSVIFIPSLTPVGFEWRLFNVRYGIMMIPAVAFFFGYIFARQNIQVKSLLVFLFILQYGLFLVNYSGVLTYQDGTIGLSAANRPNAEYFMAKTYDHGLVLLDDYARTLSIIRSGIPMQDVIYIGNKPYWQESLKTPEKYATWIIMQRDDAVWDHLYKTRAEQDRLYKYFQKVYTSPDILIFKRIDTHETS